MQPDPHMAGHCKQYVRTRCWANGCNELVPLVQDRRFRGTYCQACQIRMAKDVEREDG